MCGRYTLTCSGEEIAQQFHLTQVPNFTPKYNIAPTQAVATVRIDSQQDERQFEWMKWGLIPSWSKDAKIGAKLINARVETVTEKPSFRSAIRKRRCLILADGFYEWQHHKNQKQPYYFRLKEHQPFAFAGLWETWRSPDAENVISCTILTTDANQSVSYVHNRMPIILSPEIYSQWLDPNFTDSQQILSLLNHSVSLKAEPVSQKVNNPKFDNPECLEFNPSYESL